jgi:hypothetical protein
MMKSYHAIRPTELARNAADNCLQLSALIGLLKVFFVHYEDEPIEDILGVLSHNALACDAIETIALDAYESLEEIQKSLIPMQGDRTGRFWEWKPMRFDILKGRYVPIPPPIHKQPEQPTDRQ